MLLHDRFEHVIRRSERLVTPERDEMISAGGGSTRARELFGERSKAVELCLRERSDVEVQALEQEQLDEQFGTRLAWMCDRMDEPVRAFDSSDRRRPVDGAVRP